VESGERRAAETVALREKNATVGLELYTLNPES